MDMDEIEQTNAERIYEMEYTTVQIDVMVDEIKGSADVLAKVLFAGFNIVFLVVLGVILISNLTAY
jgi:hypothetical protein